MNEFDLLYNNIDKHSGVFKTETVTGIATSGSKTTIVDTNKSFITNMFSGAIVNFKIGTKDYYKTVVSNTENSITFTPTLPGTKATATIGTGTSEILVTAASEGVLGNTYQIKIQASSGTNDNLSASLIDGVLTVFLGKTEDVLDNTKNTATLVATAIDQLPEFISSTSNIGVVVVTTENIHFTGGVDTIDVLEGSKYIISEKVSSINKNTAGTEIFTDANPASMKLTGRTVVKTVTIESGQSLSTEVDLEDYQLCAIEMPSAWDAATLTFQGSSTSGGTFKDIKSNGLEVTEPGSNLTASAGVINAIDVNAMALAPIRYLKIRSGTSGSAVNQTANRTLTLILKV